MLSSKDSRREGTDDAVRPTTYRSQPARSGPLRIPGNNERNSTTKLQKTSSKISPGTRANKRPKWTNKGANKSKLEAQSFLREGTFALFCCVNHQNL